MAARAFVIRFPNGDFEYDVTGRAIPSVGETLRRRGMLWRVIRRARNSVLEVHVEPAEEGGRQRPHPVAQ
jgi:hypothetical protein